MSKDNSEPYVSEKNINTESNEEQKLASQTIKDFEHDVKEIILEQENPNSYMNIAFTILILTLLVIRVIFINYFTIDDN
jgi:hypothetical protein